MFQFSHVMLQSNLFQLFFEPHDNNQFRHYTKNAVTFSLNFVKRLPSKNFYSKRLGLTKLICIAFSVSVELRQFWMQMSNYFIGKMTNSV